MQKVRQFVASVTYRNGDGTDYEETFPIRTYDYANAKQLALSYVLQVLKLQDFELRIVGS